MLISMFYVSKLNRFQWEILHNANREVTSKKTQNVIRGIKWIK